ncbi:MAG: type II toxin-antitoxin system HicB family antitoxin [Mesorhizobium sp.]|nr:type II toxin-antitoxin system HicB family antitoxin [Mesorhizobium sp.]
MRHYLAVVEKEPDSAFGIIFPDIPGCVSASDTEEMIMQNAVEALQLWTEDMKAPEPSPHERVIVHPDVAEILQRGGYLISVPLIEKDTAVVRANVTFERGVLRAIDETAKQRGITRSAFLASAAKKEIERAS